jgi:hypothetical protein
MQQQKSLLQTALLFRMKPPTEEENQRHKKILELVDCSLDTFKASSWNARHDEFWILGTVVAASRTDVRNVCN